MSRPQLLRFEEIPDSGVERRIEAGAQTRQAMAKRLGEVGIERLAGVLIVRGASGGYTLDGKLDAAVTRTCVASLETFEETVSEAFTIAFSNAAAAVEGDAEVDADTPEPIPETGFDLEEILVQQLALALDPYPRKPGAEPLAKEHGNPAPASPFAGLKGVFAGRRDKE